MEQTLNAETTERIASIIKLHHEVVGLGRRSLDLALELGRLLTVQKEQLKHGEWSPWVQANLPFTSRTATTYMQLHRFRDLIKSENVSGLTRAYALLDQRKPMTEQEARAAISTIRADLAGTVVHMNTAGPAIERFRAIRDSRAYEPQFATFDEYLAAIGCTRSWFEANEKIYAAVPAYQAGGSAEPLLRAIRDWPTQPEGE